MLARVVLAVAVMAPAYCWGNGASCYWLISPHPDFPQFHDARVRAHYASGHSTTHGVGDFLPVGCNVVGYTRADGINNQFDPNWLLFVPPGCTTSKPAFGWNFGGQPEGGAALTNPFHPLCDAGCGNCQAKDPGKPLPPPAGPGFPPGQGDEDGDKIINNCDPDQVACLDLNSNGCCDHCTQCFDPDDPPEEPEFDPCDAGNECLGCEDLGTEAGNANGADGICDYCQPNGEPMGAKGDEDSDGIMNAADADYLLLGETNVCAEIEFSEDSNGDGVCDSYQPNISLCQENTHEFWEHQCPDFGSVVIESGEQEGEWCCTRSPGREACQFCWHNSEVLCKGNEQFDSDDDGICNACDPDYTDCIPLGDTGICKSCYEPCEDECPECNLCERLDRLFGDETSGSDPYLPGFLGPPSGPVWQLDGFAGPDLDPGTPVTGTVTVTLPGTNVEWQPTKLFYTEATPAVASAIEGFLILFRGSLALWFTFLFVRAILRMGSLL